MLGLQGNMPAKVYRCMACSATFTGLASLLVHQATHAAAAHAAATAAAATAPAKAPDLSLVPSNISKHLAVVMTKELSKQPPSLLVKPESPAPSFYICDCGEEFQDFDVMLEHKRLHLSTPQQPHPVESGAVLSDGDQVSPIQNKQLIVTPPHLAISCPPASLPPSNEVHALTSPVPEIKLPESTKADSDLNKVLDVVNPTNQQNNSKKELQEVFTTQEGKAQAIQDQTSEEKTNSNPSIENKCVENLPKNTNAIKLLATAYRNFFQPSQLQGPSENTEVKTEVIPVEISSDVKAETSPKAGQLKRLLTLTGAKTKAPSVGKILDSSKKSIVSLTKTFSPVVLLETRQKFFDSNNGTHGQYQCGRCRRAFQDVDSLTDHHFLHRKERIKCCRNCKQLIIGKLPFANNHVCPVLVGRTKQQSGILRSKFPIVKKILPFHNLKQQHNLNNNARKVFYCPVCKHSYARRYNLKVHKCQGQQSSLPQNTTFPVQKDQMQNFETGSIANSGTVDGAMNTEAVACVKVEDTPATSVHSFSWSGSAKSYMPFQIKASMPAQQENASPLKSSIQQEGDDSNRNIPADSQGDGEGKWIMPLDDEMDALSGEEDANGNAEGDDSVLAQNAKLPQNTGLAFFIKDGIKRYPCNRCQKTYSRSSTLRRHLMLCGFRQPGQGTTAQTFGKVKHVYGAATFHTNKTKPTFDCFCCGKTFSRKDNMLIHRKKCILKHNPMNMERGTSQHSYTADTSEAGPHQDDNSNWGIMSLPSVLPRRVTCECGAGFTSPQLLLEHLQKHAQESYTCPTCGETVGSWADYEVHLQIHMHPHHHIYKGLLPQRSQPLLLRFQQQQPSRSGPQPPLKQPCSTQLSKKKQQRITCVRCNNTFSSRASLRKHISYNRCKGGRATGPPKTTRCSRCNNEFANAFGLLFHQRSGTCKPAIKPVRCPVCFRWYGTMDSLQKHLLTHKQSESLTCDVCQGKYPSLKSLKNHRRKVHRIMAGDIGQKPKQVHLES